MTEEQSTEVNESDIVTTTKGPVYNAFVEHGLGDSINVTTLKNEPTIGRYIAMVDAALPLIASRIGYGPYSKGFYDTVEVYSTARAKVLNFVHGAKMHSTGEERENLSRLYDELENLAGNITIRRRK